MEKGKTDKKAAVLKAALELIAEHGFHGAPAADIAARAGVGVGTMYRYFENKDELIEGIARNLIDGIAGKLLHDGYPADGPVRERFMYVERGLLAHFIENPLEYRFMEQFMNSPYGAKHRRDVILEETCAEAGSCMMKDILEEGMASGLVKDLPLAILYSLSFGPVMFIIRDHILGLITVDGPLLDATVKACWDAVKA